MNIRSIQCPSCGANLKLENVNQSIIFCQFCGASIQYLRRNEYSFLLFLLTNTKLFDIMINWYFVEVLKNETL